MATATRVPKVLVHADGELFVIWNPKGAPVAYSPILTDEDVPPRPESLRLRTDLDLSRLRWVPVQMTTQELVVETKRAIGPYDPETGADL